MPNQERRQRRGDVVVAVRHGLDAVDNACEGAVLEDVASGAEVNRLVEQRLVGV